MSDFPEGNNKDGKKNKSDDDNSRASQLRESSKYNMGKLKRKMKNTFTILEANIDELGDEESELTSYDRGDSSGNSHFQFHNKPTSLTVTDKFKTYPKYYVNIPGVTTPTCVVLQQAFEERNRRLTFNKSHYKSINIELRNVILLDSQSTMDQFCNPKLVGNIYKAKKKMSLQINGCTIVINHKAQVDGYNPHV